MAALVDRSVSFRSLLKGEVDDLLNDEGLACGATSSAIVTAASRLASYREEGLRLSPEVYFCTDLRTLMTMLPGAEIIAVGEGPQTDATISRALKECAPLANAGWVIYIHRLQNIFAYGVLTSTNLPLSITPYEALMEGAVEASTSLVVRRIAENCVEIRGSRGHRRCLHFSDQRPEAPLPSEAIEKLCNVMTKDVSTDTQELVFRYCYRTLVDLLAESHGALLVVQSTRKRSLPRQFRDSVSLSQPLSLAERVADYLEHRDNEALARLNSAAALLRGMIGSDGIVVFRTNAVVPAYRAFVTPSKTAAGAAGGARRRTFEALKAMIGRELEAAFMQSQDGHTEFAGRTE